MENGIFSLEYFCRLCASEGVIIHPLFPPGDDDPKLELVRMIEVLTSVQLSRPADAGAVICDKCLQMLDVFCQFREECLRQDVLIRTKRTLIDEELARQHHHQQHELVFGTAQESFPQQLDPTVTVKLEDDNETDNTLRPVIETGDQTNQSIIPLVIDVEQCKEEFIAREESEQASVDAEEEQDEYGAPDLSPNASLLQKTYTAPGIALFSEAGSLSISVQVNQMSLGAMKELSNPKSDMPTSFAASRRGSKLCSKKVRPTFDACQETLSVPSEYEDQQRVADRSGTRCSLACDPCQMRFTKSYNLKRHMYEVHGELAPGLTVTECEHCGERFLRGYTLNRHIAKMHRNKKKLKIIAIKRKS
ncbi:zinc finger and BTB domain-containing protein 44-like [Anopheles bellator]|uniref:zinc finger and BTB domain-containing protein 44-like n=1 Tax=Anopheles bellator TaxID=139047 RepID=UPI00264722A7|nr:zinc finger and BTB domain-containing protein 44-like [Anopheles bellator]